MAALHNALEDNAMPADRLGMPELSEEYRKKLAEFDHRYDAARFAQALAVAKGLVEPATPAQRTWLDRGQRVDVSKAADVCTEDFDTPAGAPISDSILALTRTASIPQRLVGLRSMPLNTRFFVQTAAITAAQVTESKGIPVVRGDWSTTTLTPRKFGAITVATNELMRASPQAFQALVADLAQAVAAAENAAFVDPNEVGSVLNGTSTFASTGTTLAAIDADLKHLMELVPAAFRGAATFVMCGGTALYLSQLRGTGGDLAYPSMTATGGMLLGLPVLVTEAMEFDDSPVSRAIGLIDSSRVFYNSGGAMLTVSSRAGLEMSDAPTGATDTPVAASQNRVSLFQAEATAIKSIRVSAWHAAADAGAYSRRRTNAGESNPAHQGRPVPEQKFFDERDTALMAERLDKARAAAWAERDANDPVTFSKAWAAFLVAAIHESLRMLALATKRHLAARDARISALMTVVELRDRQIERHSEHLQRLQTRLVALELEGGKR